MIKIALIVVILAIALVFFKELNKYLGIGEAEEKKKEAELKNREIGINACTAVQEAENRNMQNELNKCEVEDESKRKEDSSEVN